jgi:hypothetical protein
MAMKYAYSQKKDDFSLSIMRRRLPRLPISINWLAVLLRPSIRLLQPRGKQAY